MTDKIEISVTPDMDTRALMQVVMSTLDGLMNGDKRREDRDIGIVVLMFPYGSGERNCNFISNGARRDDLAIMFRELAARLEGQALASGNA